MAAHLALTFFFAHCRYLKASALALAFSFWTLFLSYCWVGNISLDRFVLFVASVFSISVCSHVTEGTGWLYRPCLFSNFFMSECSFWRRRMPCWFSSDYQWNLWNSSNPYKRLQDSWVFSWRCSLTHLANQVCHLGSSFRWLSFLFIPQLFSC